MSDSVRTGTGRRFVPSSLQSWKGPAAMLVFASAAAAVGWSCVPEPEPEIPTTGVHELFPLSGAHTAQNCENCHIQSAIEQGLTPSSDPHFVSDLRIECLDCHSDVTAQTFPGGHMDGRSCADGGGCHSTSDWCWKQVRTDCGELNDTGIEIDHSVEPLSDIFPLDGPHAGSCGDCHAGDESNERGGSMFCSNCHEDDRPTDHYVPPRDGAESKERGCKACHAGENSDRQLVVPASWASNASVHDFVWPHAVVADWDENPPVLKNDDEWTTSCDGCHLTGQYATYTCSEACHTRTELDGLSSLHASVTYTECNQCHPDGTE